MTPYYESGGIKIYHGDCREVMPELAEESIDCCVTSPPYWGLRDYGTARWEGGAAECDHVFNRGVQGATGARATRAFTAQCVYKHACGKCGALRVDRQIGLEQTPEEYVAALVQVFREVRRVLKPDGTLWLNLGDSYAASGYSHHKNTGGAKRSDGGRQKHNIVPNGLKPKDLCGIPWRVAFALQADGWYLRSDIIWVKTAPMPESVRDRPTRSHEYIFLLTKSARYFYDADAIAEPLTRPHEGERKTPARFGGALKFTEAQKQSRLHSGNKYTGTPNGTRNARDVWTIGPQPFPEAHFAVFPEELARRCVMAGCRLGGTVLDPFSGAGTVALVARHGGCRFVGCELNDTYIGMAGKRLSQNVLGFAEATSMTPVEIISIRSVNP